MTIYLVYDRFDCISHCTDSKEKAIAMAYKEYCEAMDYPMKENTFINNKHYESFIEEWEME